MIAAGETGRLERALAGEAVEPPVRGVGFVDPALLPGAAEPGRSCAEALARAAAEVAADFAFAPSWEPWAPAAVRALRLAGVAPWWVVEGVVWPSLEEVGLERGLRALASETGALGAPMDRAVDRALSSARAGLAAGARAIVVADDMAGADGPLMAPSWLQREAFPRLATLASEARAAGVPAILHCDGDARPLLAMARDAGFAAVHGDHSGPSGMEDALAAARAVGIALVGGLATADLADPQRAAPAGARAARLALGGGLLIADDGGLHTAEQAFALLAALRAASGL